MREARNPAKAATFVMRTARSFPRPHRASRPRSPGLRWSDHGRPPARRRPRMTVHSQNVAPSAARRKPWTQRLPRHPIRTPAVAATDKARRRNGAVASGGAKHIQPTGAAQITGGAPAAGAGCALLPPNRDVLRGFPTAYADLPPRRQSARKLISSLLHAGHLCHLAGESGNDGHGQPAEGDLERQPAALRRSQIVGRSSHLANHGRAALRPARIPIRAPAVAATDHGRRRMTAPRQIQHPGAIGQTTAGPFVVCLGNPAPLAFALKVDLRHISNVRAILT